MVIVRLYSDIDRKDGTDRNIVMISTVRKLTIELSLQTFLNISEDPERPRLSDGVLGAERLYLSFHYCPWI